jgi:hypothetical protein
MQITEIINARYYLLLILGLGIWKWGEIPPVPFQAGAAFLPFFSACPIGQGSD